MPVKSDLLRELASLIEEAGRIAQKAQGTAPHELKPDGSIVTIGDRRVEEFLRERLTKLVPETKVWGEEFGFATEGPGGVWVVDPIDGTTNYAFGSPLWGVTVALLKGAEIELGVIVLPALAEVYTAAKGQGAQRNGEPLALIPPGPIRKEQPVGLTDNLFRKHPGVLWPGKMRCTGSFVVDATFVATQRFRGMVGIREKLYDIAASHLINSELGADIRYADGRPFKIEELLQDKKVESAWLMFPRDSGFFI